MATQAKREYYKDLIDRMNKAHDDEYYLEASWFAYTVLEDRLLSALRQSGGATYANFRPIRMLGKKIGRVSGTEIIGQKIAVQVTIDNSFAFKLPIDSDIEITQSDLMGGKFIAIYPGKDNNNFILPKETISGANTVAASLTEDISNFAKKINETYGQKQKEQVKNTINSIETSSALLEEFVSSNMDLVSDEDKDNLHNLLLNINNISNDL